ncbi:MAG TPA: hypothetical protein VJ970_02550, partial [Flavobacteriaceae bacterium]|nr:hypothetical protein [Flavobacteriaceae bacterium]
EIIPDAVETNRVFSHQYEGYWTDIGNIDSFFEANLGLAEDLPKFDLYSKNKRIFTHPRMLPTTKISGTILDKTVIAEGCIINAGKIENSVIGIRSRIEKEATVINTYMMGSDYYQTTKELEDDDIVCMGIGSRCFIKNAILDKNCCIGNDVRINGGKHLKDTDTDAYTIKDGIVVIKKGAVIPNGFIIA